MENFPADAEAMNAIVNALGALTYALVRHLPTYERAGFARDLASLALLAEQQGRTADETLLLDLHQAAVSAA